MRRPGHDVKISRTWYPSVVTTLKRAARSIPYEAKSYAR